MYHIYVDRSLLTTVQTKQEIGAVVVQALETNPSAWIIIKELQGELALPEILLPLPVASDAIKPLSLEEAQALNFNEVEFTFEPYLHLRR